MIAIIWIVAAVIAAFCLLVVICWLLGMRETSVEDHTVEYIVIIQCGAKLDNGSFDFRWDDRIVQIGKKSCFQEEDAQWIARDINHSIRLFLKTEQLRAITRPAKSFFPSNGLWQRVWTWQGAEIGVQELLYMDRLFRVERNRKLLALPEWEWNPNFY